MWCCFLLLLLLLRRVVHLLLFVWLLPPLVLSGGAAYPLSFWVVLLLLVLGGGVGVPCSFWWCCLPSSFRVAFLPLPLWGGAALSGPTFHSFFGMALLLLPGAAFSSLLVGGAVLPLLLLWGVAAHVSPRCLVAVVFLSLLWVALLRPSLSCGWCSFPLLLLLRGGACLFLLWEVFIGFWVVLGTDHCWKARTSSEPRASGVLVLGLLLLLLFILRVMLLGSLALALPVSLTLAMVTLLVLLIPHFFLGGAVCYSFGNLPVWKVKDIGKSKP